MMLSNRQILLVLALGFAVGCKTDKAPEAPPPASAEATKEESASSSGDSGPSSDESLYEDDPFGANLASDDDKTDTETSTGSTTDVMGALKDVQAQAPEGPDEKAMLGRAVLSSFMGVMPSLLQAGMSGQQVDLGRVGMSVAYNTGQNMLQQYGQNAQQQALQQQQAAQQQQQLQLQQQGQSYGTGQ